MLLSQPTEQKPIGLNDREPFGAEAAKRTLVGAPDLLRHLLEHGRALGRKFLEHLWLRRVFLAYLEIQGLLGLREHQAAQDADRIAAQVLAAVPRAFLLADLGELVQRERRLLIKFERVLMWLPVGQVGERGG
eukprot:jgi/Chrpa1/17611/Chrysochromulina_OHIO_Genome00022743-RA